MDLFLFFLSHSLYSHSILVSIYMHINNIHYQLSAIICIINRLLDYIDYIESNFMARFEFK